MQHALLAVAIALIVAIAAALTAPAYVNWDDWRETLETRASALVGVPVRIRGRIEATILPTPAFTLRSVEIGDAERGTGMRAGEVRGILSLGPLLRGSVEAEEFVLIRPAIRVAVEGGGLPQPIAGAAAVATDIVSFARFSIEGGSLIVEDRGSGEQQVFDEISATGEMHARRGPFRVDARFRHAGERWSLGTSTGVFGDDNTGRVRMTLQRPADRVQFDAEGMLAMGGAAPRFDGKVTLAQREGPGLPWQLAANARGNPTSVAIEGIELSLGADAAPIEFGGQVQFAPYRGGSIEGMLAARRVDLDAAAGADAPRSLPAALAASGAGLETLLSLPFRGHVGLSVESLIAGGGTVREVTADLALRGGAGSVERLDARLPGRGSFKASGGAPAEKAKFSGVVEVEAEDAAIFARWAFGGAFSLPVADARSLRFAGRTNWNDDGVTLRELDVALGEAKLGGQFAFGGGGSARLRVNADLAGSNLDLDLFAPLGQWLRSGAAAADVSLAFNGNTLRLLDRPLSRLDAAVSRTERGVSIDRFTLTDFDGLTVHAKGNIVAPLERPSGNVEYEIETARADGLALLARRLAGEDAEALARRLLGAGPLRLTGTASGAGTAAGIEVNANGRLAEMEASVAASYDILAENLSEARVVLNARDAGKLVSLFGLTPGPPSPGDGLIEMDFSKPSDGAMLMAAHLSVPGTNITAEGELRRSGEGRIEPKLELRVDAADLRPLLAVAAKAGGDRPVPASGTVKLARTADAFTFDNLELSLAGTRVRGALRTSGIEKPAVGGKLSVERMEVSALLALVFGSAREAAAFWPAARLGPAPLAGTTGTVDFEVAALGLVDRLAATDATFRLKLGVADAAIEDFTADLAGGKAQAHVRFVRGDTIGLDGSMKVSSFDLARVLVPGTWRSAVRGRGDLTLTLAGNGATPAALAGSLAGQGTISVDGLEIDRVDPAAVGAVFAAAEKGEPPDEIGVIAALSPALARGPLKLARIEAPLVAASGVVRTGKAQAKAGAADIAASAQLDIGRLTVDASVQIEAPAPAGFTAQPGATVRWRGPLAAPERGIEAAALATAINLRAMEQETKRIQERDRRAPALPNRSERAPESGEREPIAVISPPPPANPSAPPTAPARPRATNPPAAALPPLAPPIEIRPAPPVFSSPQ